MNEHRDGMDYLLGLEPAQTDLQVEALLHAANALARAQKSKNGADAHVRKGILDGITRTLRQVRRAA